MERSEAATAMNMLLYGMTELATWDRTQEELVDRSYRPWDDADRRNFSRRAILLQELNTVMEWDFTPSKIIALLKRAMQLAA